MGPPWRPNSTLKAQPGENLKRIRKNLEFTLNSINMAKISATAKFGAQCKPIKSLRFKNDVEKPQKSQNGSKVQKSCMITNSATL